jgi:hypothetical protein
LRRAVLHRVIGERAVLLRVIGGKAMLGDETMDAIRSRDDDPADILIMWMWSVGCLGWGLWKRVAYLSITLALDCDFSESMSLFSSCCWAGFCFLVYDTPCHPPVVGHISSQLVWYKIFKTCNRIMISLSSIPMFPCRIPHGARGPTMCRSIPTFR